MDETTAKPARRAAAQKGLGRFRRRATCNQSDRRSARGEPIPLASRMAALVTYQNTKAKTKRVPKAILSDPMPSSWPRSGKGGAAKG